MFNLLQQIYLVLCLYFLFILTNAQDKSEDKSKPESGEALEISNSTEIDNSTQNAKSTTPACGVCPTYFQKICGFDFSTNSTFIFDNECIMKLYNCKRETDFVRVNYERCLFFGNFAYVHGLNNDDYDYGDHVTAKYVKKNPDFVK